MFYARGLKPGPIGYEVTVTLLEESAELRNTAAAAIVEGFFAALWFSWGASDEDLPGWFGAACLAGALVALSIAALAVVVQVRLGARRGVADDHALRHAYRVIVLAEIVVLVIGVVLLSVLGADDYVPAWVAVAVGAHFFPLSTLFGTLRLKALGAVVTSVGVAALVAGLVTDVEPATVAGTGVGLALLVGGLDALLSAGRGLLTT